jgi:hypothetical protein
VNEAKNFFARHLVEPDVTCNRNGVLTPRLLAQGRRGWWRGVTVRRSFCAGSAFGKKFEIRIHVIFLLLGIDCDVRDVPDHSVSYDPGIPSFALPELSLYF